jgi:hypothetical protein
MIGFNNIGSPGRLGNQMFKYGALKGIAKQNGYSYCIPPRKKNLSIKSFLGDSKKNHYLFDAFNMGSIKKKNEKLMKNKEIITENDFSFDKKIFTNCPDNVQINGYFQSEKYFLNVKKALKSDFEFRINYKEPANNIFRELDNPISIHIRRGDYITNPNHHLLDMTYYLKSLEYFDKNRQKIIFSDDPDWVKSQKIFSKSTFIISNNLTNNDTYLDLALMTLCNDHIISNSSYSWWGAWLSNENKVIAPKTWFKNTPNDKLLTKDLIPSRWVKVDN